MSGDYQSDDEVVEILSFGDEDYEDAGQEENGAEAGAPGPEHAELGHVQQELERLRELYLRKLADFDNLRKRSAREMAEARKLANSELLRECLPVVDNLERALAVPPGDGDGLRTGVELVLRQLKDVMSRYGVEEINPEREPFDPNLHDAVARRETTAIEANHVAHVLQKGYVLHGRLLRPALVDVAVAPSGSEAALQSEPEETA